MKTIAYPFLYLILSIVSAQVIELNHTNFQNTIDNNPFILVNFYSPNCGLCKRLEPDLEQAALLLKPYNLPIAKVNALQDQILARKYSVHAFPTLYFFRLGQQEIYNGPRDNQAIFNWVHANAKPLIHYFEQELNLQEFIDHHQIALIYYESFGHTIDRTVKEVMEKIAKKYKSIGVAIVSHPELRHHLNIQDDEYMMLYRKHEKGSLPFEDANIHLLEQFVLDNGYPTVFTFTPTEKERALIEKKPLFVYTTKETSTPFELEFIEMSNFFYDIRFVLANTPEARAELTPIIKLGPITDNQIYAIDLDLEESYRLDASITIENARDFLRHFILDELVPQPKKAGPPELNDGIAVLKLSYKQSQQSVTQSNFIELVRNSTQDVLVLFYSHHCPHCIQALPVFAQLAQQLKHLKHKIIIAKNDVNAEKLLFIQMNGLPTIQLFKKGPDYKFKILDYNGPRNVEDIIEFLKQNTKSLFEVEEDL